MPDTIIISHSPPW